MPQFLSIPLPEKILDEDTITMRAMKDAFSMTKQRCYNPECADYKHYGAKGITICERWLDSFENFVQDMGLRPEGMTLERVSNTGNYNPENCVWATRQLQTRNRTMSKTITLDGVTKTLAEWSETTGIPYSTLKARINVLNYTPEQALSKPVKSGVKLADKSYTPRVYTSMKGKVAKGMESKLTALNAEQVTEIRELLEKSVPKTKIAARYSVNVCTITAVQLKKGAYSDN